MSDTIKTQRTNYQQFLMIISPLGGNVTGDVSVGIHMLSHISFYETLKLSSSHD